MWAITTCNNDSSMIRGNSFPIDHKKTKKKGINDKPKWKGYMDSERLMNEHNLHFYKNICIHICVIWSRSWIFFLVRSLSLSLSQSPPPFILSSIAIRHQHRHFRRRSRAKLHAKLWMHANRHTQFYIIIEWFRWWPTLNLMVVLLWFSWYQTLESDRFFFGEGEGR